MEAWVDRPKVLLRKRGEAQALGEGFAELRLDYNL
jgi:hypothetical protein